MASISDVEEFLSLENGLSTVSTVQVDGKILSSVVNCGLIPHPIDSSPCVAFVSGGSAARLKHIARGSEITVSVRRGWKWVAVSGKGNLYGPRTLFEDSDDESLRLLLRDVFIAAGGTHENFDEYDQVMATERRVVVCISIDRIIGNT